MKNRIAFSVLLLILFLWPIAYDFLLREKVRQLLNPSFTANSELQQLLNARRYTIKVPVEKDGQILSLVPYFDGKAHGKGGASVRGGKSLTLIVRRDQQTKRIEYCWMDGEGGLGRGAIEDPLAGGAVATTRGEGPLKIGDWIYRGGRKYVSGSPTKTADFELRLAINP